jgi:CBS domain containing-hemolysin-like protein
MTGWYLLVTAGLLLANGYFVALEFTLVASRRTRLQQLAAEGNRRARVALTLVDQLPIQLTGCQLGVTMASLGLGAVAEPAIASLLEDGLLLGHHIPVGVAHAIGIGVGLVIVVFLHLVVGEMVPKYSGLASPERLLLWLVLPQRVFVAALRPILVVLNAMADVLLRLVGIRSSDGYETLPTADELASMLAASRREGLIEDVAHELLSGALDFGTERLASVMVPRESIVFVPGEATVADAEDVVLASGHSRLPVAGDGVDDLVGFIHAKDLLTLPVDAQARPLPPSRIRRLLELPADTPLDDALLAMRRARIHLARVVDEHGRTAGLATLEDVVEDIVGDIRDESDTAATASARRRGRGARSRAADR